MQVTKTTTHLKLPRVRFDLPLPASLTIVTFALIAIAALAGRIATTPAPEMPKPIIIYATAPAAIYPTAVPQVQAAYQAAPVSAPVRMVVAFAAPGGDVLGPIVEPTIGAIVARFGDGWVGTIHDGGMVWVRTADLGLNLANVEPAAPAYQQPPAPAYAPEQSYQTDTYAAPTPVQQEAPAGPPVNERQAAIQGRLANEHAPVVAPVADHPMPQSPPDDVTRALMQTAWEQEHCFAGKCIP